MYTSMNTSTNASRPAAAYGFCERNNLFVKRTVLDYGCGKYWENCKAYAKEHGALNWTGFDPFWKPQNLRFRVFDTIICANVLNVIEDDRELNWCIQNVLTMLDALGVAVFQIYEGNKSGIGRETKPDCWQRNEKAQKYADRIFMNRAFEPATMEIFRIRNFIIVKDCAPF